VNHGTPEVTVQVMIYSCGHPDVRSQNMTQKLIREEREMQQLMKKIQKKVKAVPVEKRWQDVTTRRDDEGVEEALDLFREMKQRDF